MALAAEFISRFYDSDKVNSYDDALRHTLWPAFMYKFIGELKAKSFLNAHEENPLQSLEEKEMDISNNQIGSEKARI
jgi:hypothetical protein